MDDKDEDDDSLEGKMHSLCQHYHELAHELDETTHLGEDYEYCWDCLIEEIA